MNKNVRNALLFIGIPLLMIGVMALVGNNPGAEKPMYSEIVGEIPKL